MNHSVNIYTTLAVYRIPPPKWYKRFFYTLSTIAITLISPIIVACQNLPAEQLWSSEELVNNTNSIVLAQAYKPQSVSGDTYITEFFVTEVLKGNQQNNFSLTGKLAYGKTGRNTFDNHNDIQFWAYSDLGNFSRDENCQVYGHFEEGRQYLLFVDQAKHPRSFELIESPSDGWLLEIKKIINQ
ncbi:MAG: hypothetical protein ACRBBR_11515 [Cellvibrionaceae bacterium]